MSELRNSSFPLKENQTHQNKDLVRFRFSHSHRFSFAEGKWCCPGTQTYCGTIKRDLLKGKGLVKHPSPAQPPPSAARQLLVVQGSAEHGQIQATLSCAEHRGLTDIWWASYFCSTAPRENLPRTEPSAYTCTPQPSGAAFLPNGPLS